MNIPKIQVICEPRNHGFLNKFYRANNDSGILYHQTKVEYKSHLPYWHQYVPMWWPGLGDFGMNSGILIECLTEIITKCQQTSICLLNVDKQIMPKPDEDSDFWYPGRNPYGRAKIWRDGDVDPAAGLVVGQALNAYVSVLKKVGSESKLFLTIYFNIPAPMAERVLRYYGLHDLNIVESCEMFPEEIRELAEKHGVSWKDHHFDLWMTKTCGNRWLAESIFPLAGRYRWSYENAIPYAMESEGPLDKSILHSAWVKMRQRPHIRDFYNELKLSDNPVAIHPKDIGDEDWKSLSFLWENHLIRHVGNNEFIQPCPMMKKWIDPKSN
jgi:hypothetical protein